MKYVTQLFNSTILKGYFPAQSRTDHPPPKTREPPYRPIGLLPIISKVFEKLLIKRLLLMVENNRLIPNHQFGFRQMHSTLEQTHRIMQRINEAIKLNLECLHPVAYVRSGKIRSRNVNIVG
jgi:hypothetical protein